MKKINHEEFLKLYNKGLSDSEIGRQLDLTNSCIHYHRKIHKLPCNFKYISKIDKDKFLNLYKKGLNDREIAEKLNISDTLVNDFRNKLKLKVNLRNNNVKVNSIQKQILVGSLLGDLHINLSKGNINSGGSFAHSTKQREYFLYKYNILKSLCGNITEYEITNKNSEIYSVISTNLKTNLYLTNLYNISYKNKIKYIDKELLKNFTKRSLAIMYCDDGSKIGKTYSIATNCFTIEDINIFREFLLEKWNIETTIHKRNVLYILKRSSNTFTKLIKPFIIKEMEYKLHMCSQKIG